jgi:hypothetical protein
VCSENRTWSCSRALSSFDVANNTCVTKLKKLSSCPNCGKKTVAASWRVNRSGGGGGGGGGGGDSDSGGSPPRSYSPVVYEAEVDDEGEAMIYADGDIEKLVKKHKIKRIRPGIGKCWDAEFVGILLKSVRARVDVLKSVETIKIYSEDALTKDVAANFAAFLSALSGLKTLEISRVELDFFTPELIRTIVHLPSLETLELGLSDFGDAQAVAFGEAMAKAPMTKLKSFPITTYDSTPMTIKGVLALLGGLAGKVRDLDADFDTLYDVSQVPVVVAALCRCLPTLTRLVLPISEEKATPAWAPLFAALRSCTALNELTLKAYEAHLLMPQVSSLISAIEACPSLEALEISGVRDFSADDFLRLLKMLVRHPKLHTFHSSFMFNDRDDDSQYWWRAVRCARALSKKKGWKKLTLIDKIWIRLDDSEREKLGMEDPPYDITDVEADEDESAVESFEDDTLAVPAARVMPPTAGRLPGRVAAPAPVARALPTAGRAVPVVTPVARVMPPTAGRLPGRVAAPAPVARALPTAVGGGRAAIAAARAAVPVVTPVPATVGEVGSEWKLKDKKSIKAAADAHESAISSIKSKLGDEWNLVVDWTAFGKATEGKDDREPGENVINRIVCTFADDDVASFDDDEVEALNAHVTARLITLTCVKVHKNGSRCTVKAAAGGVTIAWSADFWGYSYNEAMLKEWVLQNC